MQDIAPLLQPDRGQAATSIHLVDKKSFEDWLKAQPDRARQAVQAQGFKGEGFQLAILPGQGDGWSAVLGVANVEELSPWCLAKAAEALSEGTYRVAGRGPGPATLGWLLGQYRFDGYREKKKDQKGPRVLLSDEPARIEETVLLAESTFLVRDLVNIPAGDLGPAELQAAVEDAARPAGAKTRVTAGAALDKEFPMVAAVGRAASNDRAPRLIELEWGDQRHPRIAIVGKGVCFDSGGLDIKPASGMRLMKKDMGGAGHALGLARLVMKARLPVRLHLVIPAVENAASGIRLMKRDMGGAGRALGRARLVMRARLPVRLHLVIPAVENAVSGAAFRPGDVLRSRKGLTVEVGNTDAEGRLILADALTLAAEGEPELILDFATLTGAARVALGPDLPALFANDDQLAQDLLVGGEAVSDPLWRLPLWKHYADMLKSDIADIVNSSDSPM